MIRPGRIGGMLRPCAGAFVAVEVAVADGDGVKSQGGSMVTMSQVGICSLPQRRLCGGVAQRAEAAHAGSWGITATLVRRQLERRKLRENVPPTGRGPPGL